MFQQRKIKTENYNHCNFESSLNGLNSVTIMTEERNREHEDISTLQFEQKREKKNRKKVNK